MSTVETIATIQDRVDSAPNTRAPGIALGAATISAGLGAGVYYAYQVSVIRALAEVDDAAYVAAFQAVNKTIQNPWFISVFLGTSPLIAAALVLDRRAARPITALIGAGLAFQVASVGITVFGNIPLNENLDRLGPVVGEAATLARADFEGTWNRWHLARTVASVASFASLGIASLVRSRA